MRASAREFLLVLLSALAWTARADGSSVIVEVPVKTLLAEGSAITNSLTVNLVPVEREWWNAELCMGDDSKQVSRDATYTWEAKKLGYIDVTHTMKHASGWNSLSTWYQVVCMEEPFPDIDYNDGSHFLEPVLAAAQDSRLAKYVELDEYLNNFRPWLKTVAPEGENEKRQAILNSPSAYGAYALKVNEWPDATPTNLTIEAISPSASEAGQWELVASIPSLAVGSDATATDLGRVFSVSGAEALNAASFDAKNVSATFAPTSDGKVKATITPANSAATSFFFRVGLQY